MEQVNKEREMNRQRLQMAQERDFTGLPEDIAEDLKSIQETDIKVAQRYGQVLNRIAELITKGEIVVGR